MANIKNAVLEMKTLNMDFYASHNPVHNEVFDRKASAWPPSDLNWRAKAGNCDVSELHKPRWKYLKIYAAAQHFMLHYYLG